MEATPGEGTGNAISLHVLLSFPKTLPGLLYAQARFSDPGTIVLEINCERIIVGR